MKVKEKLALEATENCGEYTNTCYKWYLKGFEKAREMASKEANDTAIPPNLCEHELDPHYNMGCWESALKIKEIGEEELE